MRRSFRYAYSPRFTVRHNCSSCTVLQVPLFDKGQHGNVTNACTITLYWLWMLLLVSVLQSRARPFCTRSLKLWTAPARIDRLHRKSYIPSKTHFRHLSRRDSCFLGVQTRSRPVSAETSNSSSRSWPLPDSNPASAASLHSLEQCNITLGHFCLLCCLQQL